MCFATACDDKPLGGETREPSENQAIRVNDSADIAQIFSNVVALLHQNRFNIKSAVTCTTSIGDNDKQITRKNFSCHQDVMCRAEQQQCYVKFTS